MSIKNVSTALLLTVGLAAYANNATAHDYKPDGTGMMHGHVINPDGIEGESFYMFDPFVESLKEMDEDNPFKIIREVPGKMKKGEVPIVDGTLKLYCLSIDRLQEISSWEYSNVKQNGGDLIPPGNGERYPGGWFMYVYPFLDAVKRYHSVLEDAVKISTANPSFFDEEREINEVIVALGGDCPSKPNS